MKWLPTCSCLQESQVETCRRRLEEKGESFRPDEWPLSWLALWLKFILKVSENAIVCRSWTTAKRQAGSLSCKENHRELLRNLTIVFATLFRVMLLAPQANIIWTFYRSEKLILRWPDSLDLLWECCWDMQTWEWQNKQKAAKSTRGVKSAKYLTTSLHTCKWEAASCTLPQLVSWHLRGNDCCHLGRQKPWNELITQGCAALGLLHCKLESKGF